MWWRRLILYFVLAFAMSLAGLVAIVGTGLVLGDQQHSQLEGYALLALIGGMVAGIVILTMFHLLGMRPVVRDGRVFLEGGLAGRTDETAKGGAAGSEHGSSE